jgi:broad specificity phosphatase PhoE
MRLYVIRHGESHVNVQNHATLRSMDTSLTEKGEQQAQALHDWLVKHNRQADALYASTMRRTRETARYVSAALGCDIAFDDRLREIGNNYIDGRPRPENDLPRQFDRHATPDQAPFLPRVSGVADGESVMHLRLRVARFIHDVSNKHPKQTVYVVAHGGVLMALFDNIFNTGMYRMCQVQTENTGWSYFHYTPTAGRKTWQLLAHNRIDHLIEAGMR